MWDNVENHPRPVRLSHDLPCSRCGHAMHPFLACSDTCDCEPTVMPGGLPALTR